jgi:long-chain fatty acid transport protein
MHSTNDWFNKVIQIHCRQQLKSQIRCLTRFWVFALCLASAGAGRADGFRISGGLSTAGLGTADTLVANPVELGALAYNPAAMSFHKGWNLVSGVSAVWLNTSVKPEGENNSTSDDPRSPIFVPNLYLMSPVSDRWTLGLAVNAPFGLETNWQEGTFPAFAGPLAPLEPSKSRLEMFNLNPNIAYRINEHASIAVGLDYYWVKDATSDTQGVRLSGDGDDLGWNAALLYVFDRWSFGVSYLSAVKVKIDAEFDATRVLGFKVDATTELKFPDILRLGVRYQATEKIAVEFDFDRIGWSTFDKIVVKSKDNLPAAGISSGSVLAENTNNWRNTNAWHIAATYQFMPATQLRLGYSLQQTPQPESHFSPRFPSARLHLFSAGLKREFKGWDLEGGIMYARNENRTIDNSEPFTGGDANGTTVYNGKYKFDAIFAGIGVNFYF